jgi:hypothetical protein
MAASFPSLFVFLLSVRQIEALPLLATQGLGFEPNHNTIA